MARNKATPNRAIKSSFRSIWKVIDYSFCWYFSFWLIADTVFLRIVYGQCRMSSFRFRGDGVFASVSLCSSIVSIEFLRGSPKNRVGFFLRDDARVASVSAASGWAASLGGRLDDIGSVLIAQLASGWAADLGGRLDDIGFVLIAEGEPETAWV